MLHDYLQDIGLKKRKFCELAGISIRTMSYICSGRKVCATIALTVEEMTGGIVKSESICSNKFNLDETRSAIMSLDGNFFDNLRKHNLLRTQKVRVINNVEVAPKSNQKLHGAFNAKETV